MELSVGDLVRWQRGQLMVSVSLDWRIMGVGVDVVRLNDYPALWDFNWPLFWKKKAWRVMLACIRRQFSGLYTLRVGPLEVATWMLRSDAVRVKKEESGV